MCKIWIYFSQKYPVACGWTRLQTMIGLRKNRCIDFQKEKFFDHRWSILEAVDKIRIRYNSYTNFNKRELVYFSTMGY